MVTDLPTALGRYFSGDQAILADPYPLWRELRERGPVHQLAAGTGQPWDDAWHVFDYAGVASLLRDDRLSARRDMGGRRRESATFGTRGSGEDAASPGVPPMMLTMDPPDHTRLRRLVSAAFTPRVVERLRGEVQSLVDDLLDRAEATGPAFDLVRGFSYPLPTIVIAQLLGVPAADWERFKRWSDPGISFARDPRAITNAIALGGYLRAAVAHRRVDPGDDLISALIAARDQGDVLSDEELIGQCQLLLVAGHETTSYAIASAVLDLLRQPGAWASLAERPIEVAVEELLRYDSPFQTLNRRATADIEVPGGSIPAGALVWLWLGAANHDPAQFANPDDLDLGRRENRHLAFGLGIHFCLGAALARLEMQAALATLRQRYPRLRLVDPVVTWRDPAIRGPKTLPVRWA